MSQKDKLIKKLKSNPRTFTFHKPHPRQELLQYQIKQLREKLEQEGLI